MDTRHADFNLEIVGRPRAGAARAPERAATAHLITATAAHGDWQARWDNAGRWVYDKVKPPTPVVDAAVPTSGAGTAEFAYASTLLAHAIRGPESSVLEAGLPRAVLHRARVPVSLDE